MPINSDAAFSRGDLVREIRTLKDRVKELETRRDLPHASYGTGGPRTRGGRFLAEDLSGEKVFEVTTEPPDIFMRPELISTVARQVIGNSVYFDVNTSNAGNQDISYPTGGYIDPDVGGDPGPTVSDVEISDIGRAIVTVGASFRTTFDPDELASVGMSYEVTGDSSVSASGTRGVGYQIGATDDPGFVSLDLSSMHLLTGLNPGLHTFQGKYLANPIVPPASGSQTVRFGFPFIQVIAF